MRSFHEKKYVLQCAYCNSVFTTTDDNLNYVCPHCGGSNDQRAVIQVTEEEERVKQKPKKKPISLVGVILLAVLLTFGLPVIVGVIVLSFEVADQMKEEMSTYQSGTQDYWKTDAKTEYIIEPVQNVIDALENKDYEGLLEWIYLPEGSVYDLSSFQKQLLQDPDFSALVGKHYEITNISGDGDSAENGTVRFQISLAKQGESSSGQTYVSEWKFMSENGDWKLRLDSCFYYGYQYMLPVTGTFWIDDEEVSKDCIVINNPKGSNSVVYEIPVMSRKSHVVRYETTFCSFQKTIQNDQGTYSDYEPKPLFEIEEGNAILSKINTRLDQFSNKMVRVAYGLEDISILREYVSSDYDQAKLQEQIACFQQKIQDDGGIYNGDANGYIYRAFPISEEEIAIVYQFSAGDQFADEWYSHHTAQGKIKLVMEDDKIVIKEFFDNGMFLCDQENHIHDLPW